MGLVVLLVEQTDLLELVALEALVVLQILDQRYPRLLVVYTEAVVAAQSWLEKTVLAVRVLCV